MKHTLALLIALLLTPRAALHAADTPKPAKRAWESAPAEKQTLWQQHKDALTILDMSEQTNRHVIIAQGPPQEYHAHPTTALLADNKTIFCVWNMGQGTPSGGHFQPHLGVPDDRGSLVRRNPHTMVEGRFLPNIADHRRARDRNAASQRMRGLKSPHHEGRQKTTLAGLHEPRPSRGHAVTENNARRVPP